MLDRSRRPVVATRALCVLLCTPLLLPAGATAGAFEQAAADVPVALPQAAVPPLPAPFAPAAGERVASHRAAFRAYASAVLERCAACEPAVRAALATYLKEPAAFRLVAGDPGSEAFLDLTQRFAAARLTEPVVADTIALVAFPTFRADPGSVAGADNAAFHAAMQGVRDWLARRVAELNAAAPDAVPLELYEWSAPRQDGDGENWILGVRTGRGPRRISVLTHLDTVGPIRDDWRPFEGRVELLEFRGRRQPFVRGRGAIDDKGPTAAALHVLDVLRSIYGGTAVLEDCTFELAADTAEETNRMVPAWLEAVGTPEAGNVFDSVWSVFAEKGIERPVFRTAAPEQPAEPAGLHLVSLATPEGPVNQIPDRATAVFAPGLDGLEAVRARLEAAAVRYLAADSPRARLEVAAADGLVTVTAHGSGAAHGSAPHVNRETGHNPLACLSGFVASLEGQLAPSTALGLPLFLAWAFGHNVFGEDHPELLVARDATFTEGTTYALTRASSGPEGGEARVDVRYALGHHAVPWDGRTFGTLPGESRFGTILGTLVERFNATLPSGLSHVTFQTVTRVAPDLKDRRHPVFVSLIAAYAAVVGQPSPLIAMGGGTDAKGYPMLYACGPNFGADPNAILGPPVNYHGIDEAAPVEDLVRSAQILLRWLPSVGFAGPPAR